MPEYIDRKDAVAQCNAFCSICSKAFWIGSLDVKCKICDIGALKNKLRNIPAADVEPVRHGKWIADKEDIEWGNHLIHYRCSECKERPHFDKDKYKFILSPYCPNCGARMNRCDGQKMTNADRIRTMSDEELAKFIAYLQDVYSAETFESYNNQSEIDYALEWLKKEARDECS